MAEKKKLKARQEKVKETTKKTPAQLMKEISKAEGIISAIGDGISILDRAFKVFYQNQVEKDMMGVHVGEFCYKAYVKSQDMKSQDMKSQDICGGCPVALTFKDGRIPRWKEIKKG